VEREKKEEGGKRLAIESEESESESGKKRFFFLFENFRLTLLPLLFLFLLVLVHLFLRVFNASFFLSSLPPATQHRMEAYRREVEKMKQLQEGKGLKERRRFRTISKKKPLLTSFLLSSPLFSPLLRTSRRPAQRRGAAEAHPTAA